MLLRLYVIMRILPLDFAGVLGDDPCQFTGLFFVISSSGGRSHGYSKNLLRNLLRTFLLRPCERPAVRYVTRSRVLHQITVEFKRTVVSSGYNCFCVLGYGYLSALICSRLELVLVCGNRPFRNWFTAPLRPF